MMPLFGVVSSAQRKQSSTHLPPSHSYWHLHSPSSPPSLYQSTAPTPILGPVPTPLPVTTGLATYSTTNLPANFYPPPPLAGHYQSYIAPSPQQQQVYWHATPAPAQTPEQPCNRPLRSCVNISGSSISQTLYDAGDLAYELHDQVLGTAPPKLTTGGLLLDTVSVKFIDVITSIDDGSFSGLENDLAIRQIEPVLRGGDARDCKRRSSKDRKMKSAAATTQVVDSGNHFSKVYLYANSRLPPHLPPLKVYFATWPLLCLAAQYSRRAYDKPSSDTERHTHIEADWRRGTKAMVIKSVVLDDMNTIVFAIRGTQNFHDWAVNMQTEPRSPRGFLDDAGNLCHAGFLSAARKMVRPVAQRLQDLLRENPHRSACSLIITGHSAGGAVASLLYSHMLSQITTTTTIEGVQSELTHLRGFFKRVHCITFGAPPVSLLPLEKPNLPIYHKSLFFSFINEGDPVPRADRAYVLSLLELYACPAPRSTLNSLLPSNSNNPSTKQSGCKADNKQTSQQHKPVVHWKVPTSVLSTAGRLVILRAGTKKSTSSTSSKKKKEKNNNKSHHSSSSSSSSSASVEACITTDTELRGVIFGDPMMHTMDLYAARIEALATDAVTAKLSTR